LVADATKIGPRSVDRDVGRYRDGVLLAELEICHSRPIAPTRRVAVGRSVLPCDPAPGFGGILLGAICARLVADIDEDLLPDLLMLSHELESGLPIPQPRLRHRFQQDRVGLARSWQRLHGEDGSMTVQLDSSRAAPAQLVLGAVYAAGALPGRIRPSVMDAVRRGLAWSGDVGPDLFASLAGRFGSGLSADAVADPVGWALVVLGMEPLDRAPDRSLVQRRFRDALRDAHPDHGASEEGAAGRIAEIAEARRILLAS
jgi:hypothetical protein